MDRLFGLEHTTADEGLALLATLYDEILVAMYEELLKEENEIVILELHPGHEAIAAFRDAPALVGNLTDKPVHAYRAED